jgi:hypothetical protein
VRHHRGQLADRGELLLAAQFPLRAAQLDVGTLEVAAELRVAE